MDINCGSVKNIMERYINNELTKSELSTWAYDALHFLLSGGVLELERLSLWEIITLLTQIDDDDPCSFAEIKQAYEVLNGDIERTYMFEMTIPAKFVGSDIIKMRELMLNYFDNGTLTKPEVYELQAFSQRVKCSTTIIDLLETQTAALIANGFSFFAEEAVMTLDVQSRVFTSNEQFADNLYLSRIKRLLDCCVGMQSFCVEVKFKKGVTYIAVIT